MDILRSNDGSLARFLAPDVVAKGMLDVVTMPLTHFSVLVSASSPQSVGKPKNSHNTVHLLTDKDE